jgi:hypothetical protein
LRIGAFTQCRHHMKAGHFGFSWPSESVGEEIWKIVIAGWG